MKEKFEEIFIKCIGCGKKIKIVKRKEKDIESFLCQQCAKRLSQAD